MHALFFVLDIFTLIYDFINMTIIFKHSLNKNYFFYNKMCKINLYSLSVFLDTCFPISYSCQTCFNFSFIHKLYFVG